MDTEVTGGSAKEGTSAVDLPIVDVEKDAAMKPLFHRRADCRLCHSSAVEVVVPLAPIPVATPNVGAATVAGRSELAAALAPLDLYLCRDCGHLQLLDVINPEVQYNNFAYTTAISLGLTEHFGRMADAVIAHAGLAPGDLVVEVGSNDGTLLRFFKERGMSVLGIDPARAIAAAATAAGIETIALFFTDELARRIRDERGPARVVISNNTFANLDDLDDPTAGIRRLLADDGLFVFETQHGADVIRRLLVDTIYHEHLSYFLVGPLVDFFARHGMELVAVEHLTTKGGSIRGYAQLAGGPHRPDGSVVTIAAQEAADSLDSPQSYRRFVDRLAQLRQRMSGAVAAETRAGRRIAGYGASVGTVTLVNQFELGRVLDFIADDKPLTQALLGPGYRIPVVAPDALYAQRPDLVVILAWRYAEPIMAKHRRYTEGGGRFVVPWPDFSIHGNPARA
jgi:SAM-dependent methyltransferase